MGYVVPHTHTRTHALQGIGATMLNSIDSLPHQDLPSQLWSCEAFTVVTFQQFPVVTGGYRAKSNHREGFTAPQLGR